MMKDKVDDPTMTYDPEAPTPVSAPPTPPKGRLIEISRQAATDVPNNVSTKEQLKLLPPEFLSGDEDRPLRHVDDRDSEFRYSLNPMSYAVLFILSVELFERFSFYAINYTQTSYLTGAYNEDWNAEMTAVDAASFVSISNAVAYTAPFVGAFLADAVFGDYWTIITGAIGLYIPGLVLIAMTAVPHLLGESFNRSVLAFGLLFLWPLGTGVVKSVVNVFGAKQFHPLIQSSLIESYYVSFYMCINIGALAGGFIVPIMAQMDITVAYFIPVAVLSVGVLAFVSGTSRYVRSKPRGDLLSGEDDGTGLSVHEVARVCMLIIPFTIAYSQMATIFIIQGTVMEKFGFIDAAAMNNADAFAVLWFGYLIGNNLYPWLAKRGIKLQTTYKFALGTFMGVLAISWALLVDYWIHRTYALYGDSISVLWQAPSYMLIGVGEIFAVSTAYEVAFTSSPPQKKALASAFNIFSVGGIPNVLCIMLYHACAKWFENSSGSSNIHSLELYAEAHVYKYFCVLLVIAILGVMLNLSPRVRKWVKSILDKAEDAIRTPKQTPLMARRKMEREAGEKAPLLQTIKKHQQYLKYGTGPILHKSGSMRAGPFLQKTDEKALERQKKYVQYQLRRPVIRRESSLPDEKPEVKEAPY
jgi:dipeptide/tripeptide permease